MKKIIIFMLLACMLASGMIFQRSKQQLPDGLYLVEKLIYDTNSVMLKPNQLFVHFKNHDLLQNESDTAIAKGVIINAADFVPLLLAEEPTLLSQTETTKKLQLTFSRLAAEKLERFTAANIMKQAALIADGEALTVNKIRDTIRGGKMEITSSHNACERLYIALKNHNVKKTR